MNYEPKEKFLERMRLLLDDEKDLELFLQVSRTLPKKSLRVNTLKISPEILKHNLEKNYNWTLNQLKAHPEIMQVSSSLLPGEIGKTKEHILGYYYVQEITSMMPVLALNPRPNETILDLCASPGSKTTQMASLMNNQGLIIANDLSIGRISILSANLEKCGVTNTIVTRHDGKELYYVMDKIIRRYNDFKDFSFDKILLDAPCSGEGNIRISPRTYLEWSENLLNNLSKRQKRLIETSFKLLKKNGIMVYSTCTHAPEENEEVVDHLLKNFKCEIVPVVLPIKTRPGITKWKEKTFDKSLKNAIRIYHHDNDMEGFFLCKIRKLE